MVRQVECDWERQGGGMSEVFALCPETVEIQLVGILVVGKFFSCELMNKKCQA